jgi:hypothetical protein
MKWLIMFWKEVSCLSDTWRVTLLTQEAQGMVDLREV